MSAYIRTLDPNHLISVGDVGFLNRGGVNAYMGYQNDPFYTTQSGDDFEALLQLANIDFGTFHTYSYSNNTTGIYNPTLDTAWGIGWIDDYVTAATAIAKPVVLEEFGYVTASDQNSQTTAMSVLGPWMNEAQARGVAGWLIWDVQGYNTFASPAVQWTDDTLGVPYCMGQPTCNGWQATQLGNAAQTMNRP